MRQIKFRGKRIDTGEWVFGFLCYNINHEICIQVTLSKIINDLSDYSILHPVNPESIGQFIGIIDKKSKVELYEDDIVEAWSTGSHSKFIIYWRQTGSPCYILYPAWQLQMFWKIHGSEETDGTYTDDLKIIGNKTDTPELYNQIMNRK